MILFLILGLVFLIFGFLIIYLAIYYRIHGQPHEGKVYAIEEYISIQRENGIDREHILFRPIYEYNFKNTTYYFFGGGSNNISKKIGEKINIYVLTSRGPDFCTTDISFRVWFGVVFSIIGFIAIMLFLNKADFSISNMALIFLAFAFASIWKMLTKVLVKQSFVDGYLKNSQMIAKEHLKDLKLMSTQMELDQFKHRSDKIGLYFGIISTTIFTAISFFLWKEKLTDVFKLEIAKSMYALDLSALSQALKDNPTFLGFCIFALFSLITLLSSLRLIK